MLRLTLAFLVAQSSALALQPVHARSAAAVVRSAAAMMSGPEATRDSEAADAEADAYAKMLAHLRAPIRQYEGGWGDTAMRDGGKNKELFGKGPTPHLKDEDAGTEDDAGTQGGGSTLSPEKQAQLVLPEESFKITKLEVSQTDQDFVMECALGAGETDAELLIDIKPMFLTNEEYFYGFTADSDPKISIDHGKSSAVEGESLIKGSLLAGIEEERVTIKLKFKPEFAAGECVAHLCFILPNEEHSCKFYKITGKCTE